ncbi:hypothetical protein SNEBB_001416 [Seison nebaliae]|nr:hypothetical protein SNEBB_001416 [Seison nebaliae]
MSKYKYGVICSSNQNRSTEIHRRLKQKHFHVHSYGVGEKVKLPGMSVDRPNLYSFGTTYDEMYKDLEEKNGTYYRSNGLLDMLHRNRLLKDYPEKFQEIRHFNFDVLFTVENRIFVAVHDFLVNKLKSIESNAIEEGKCCHVINIHIKDTHESAKEGGNIFMELAMLLEKSNCLENDIDDGRRLTSDLFRRKKS